MGRHVKPTRAKPTSAARAPALAAALLAATRDAAIADASNTRDSPTATLSLLASAWSAFVGAVTPANSPLLQGLPTIPDASAPGAFLDLLAQIAPSPRHPFGVALALERVYEALLAHDASASGSTRARLGAVYTPRELALGLTRDAWSRLAPTSRPAVLDPSCGSGRFLLAAVDVAAATRSPLPVLHGFDIDPCAVFIARALLHSHPLIAPDGPTIASRIRWCDALASPALDPRFDLVLGNPPFLNQLERRSARSSHHARALTASTDGVIKGYADTASAFLHHAISLTRPAGVICMIQPLSLLAARDARPLRAWCSRIALLESLWVGDTHAFAASVHACAPTFRKSSPATAASLRVTLSRGLPPRTVARVRATPTTRWSVLASRACAFPNLHLDADLPTLRTWLDATADFRDVYYALRDLIVESPEAASHLGISSQSTLIPILNTGLIELAASSWGTIPARMYRRRWLRPAFDLTRARAHPFLSRVLPLRLRPKLILATQTRIIEAFVDEPGTWMPTTPLISLTPRNNAPDLYTIAAALCSPVSTLVAARRTFGTSMSPRAIKLAAREVLDLPIPHDASALGPAAAALRDAASAHANADAAGYAASLDRFSRAAVDAYALSPIDRDRLLDWWHARRPAVAQRSSPTPHSRA